MYYNVVYFFTFIPSGEAIDLGNGVFQIPN